VSLAQHAMDGLVGFARRFERYVTAAGARTSRSPRGHGVPTVRVHRSGYNSVSDCSNKKASACGCGFFSMRQRRSNQP
jgi:hypothetical protein